MLFWVCVANLADRKERRTEVRFLPLLKMDAECLVSSVPLWHSSETLGAGPGDMSLLLGHFQSIRFTAMSRLTVRSCFPDDLLDPQCADPAGLEDAAAVVSTAAPHHCWETTLRPSSWTLLSFFPVGLLCDVGTLASASKGSRWAL